MGVWGKNRVCQDWRERKTSSVRKNREGGLLRLAEGKELPSTPPTPTGRKEI